MVCLLKPLANKIKIIHHKNFIKNSNISISATSVVLKEIINSSFRTIRD